MRAPLTCVAVCALGIIGVEWGCSLGHLQYPLASPLWEDPDTHHVPEEPSPYYSGIIGDFLDHSFFRKLADLFSFPLSDEASNVNAIDEVPNSSWFINRIGLFPVTPEQAARGACTDPPLDPNKGPWIVSGAKPDGVNPGFFIKTPQGRYLLKFDGPLQPQRATAADVIGSRIYWTVGYHTPCNEIVYFRRSVLRIGANAKAKTKLGEKVPLEERHIDKVLKMAFRLKNGMLRAVASKFIEGKPLGPYKYEGTRDDDPNDVIAHENRRELRAHRLLAAWVHHFDAREQNSLDVWVNEGGRSFILHYKIDWGDCFGNRNHPWAGFSQRLGFTYAVDYLDILVDLITLGITPRPWLRAQINPEAEIFGFYSSKDFVPSEWKPEYPNPAFERMTFSDALWMVRIISRFTDEHIRAIVSAGKLTDPQAERYLVRTLIERRDKILEEYLTRHAPLDRFRLVRRTPGRPEQSLCYEDLATKHRLVDHRRVLYKLRFYGMGESGKLDNELGWLQFQPDPDHPHRSCVLLPIGDRRPADLAPEGARDDHTLRYGLLKIFIFQKPTLPPTSSIWLHFFDMGPQRGYRLVGLHRMPKPVPPDLL